ncbi:hypothetical protein K4K61_007526 [Colletotrichum sp. SAR11_59]|uniref:Uncharacterized protein n=1 Tax=Colletotrichum noveboracense TaxID=2664923 RepID=A0A9W4SAX0_9PEZI|nr:uncharacterized protein CGMCC3_g6685 [Colletotrichum fructicola]XP_053042812.1 uncharacterized protein COL26b_000135 [Colletotrichum chrysophilum]KAI8158157.1 hypothetical protein K4K49_008091 [Colletotrichum sp. SAR 10_70]KAI8161887.1 hypothetical protein K4K50_000917 [Colletotrichum sp. SAR 10_71]KAI8198147.1 hypothetical protein KHU50_009036 [Colletotrichum sp. SAR 10_65]KAI8214540.1 hypothetical protein K4K52_000505 [Colletotrichum sp. SAR 10_76]KAI8262870.1 hypothetical protein K4K53_
MSAQPNTKFAPAPKTTVNGREMSFKEQLDQAAHDAREPDEPPKQNPIIEKAAAKILGNPPEEKEEKISRPGIPGPPERPYNDAQVEEFIRQQHRSKGEDGMLE